MWSCPAMVESSVAQSRTSRVNVPTVSSAEAKAMSPYREMRPYVGFNPTTPHSAAGWRTEPPVSVPSPHTASPAATAAAEPPEEPPGTVDTSHGLRVGKYEEFSVEEPMANSSQFVLPSRGVPAAFSRAQHVASYGGTYVLRICEPHVVVTPAVTNTSFRARGMPAAAGKSSSPARSFPASSWPVRSQRSVTPPPTPRSGAP